MEIQVGKTYVTDSGILAECIGLGVSKDYFVMQCIGKDNDYTYGMLFRVDMSGVRGWSELKGNILSLNLDREYVPPVVTEGWLNLYKATSATKSRQCNLWPTREDADRYAGSSRVACVPFKFTEGEGLSFSAMVGDTVSVEA